MPAEDPGADASAEWAARRTLALFVVAVLAVTAGVVALVLGDRDDVPPETGDAAQIGPEPGTDVGAYVAERRTALNQTEGRRLAVVSLTEYVDVERLDAILGSELDLRAVLVTFPGGEARRVRDVDEARRTVRAEAARQIAEIDRLLPTVDDAEFAEFYRSEVVRYQGLVEGADRPDVVHGAVVAGRAGDLRALASRPAVRLVDVGPEPGSGTAPEVRGLRPEETVRTGEPLFRP